MFLTASIVIPIVISLQLTVGIHEKGCRSYKYINSAFDLLHIKMIEIDVLFRRIPQLQTITKKARSPRKSFE